MPIEEHGEWKFLMWDEEVKRSEDADGQFRISLGARKRANGICCCKDGKDGSEIMPQLTFLEDHDDVVKVELDDFGAGGHVAVAACRSRRSRRRTAKTVQVTTIYDLLMAQYGVNRGLAGRLPGQTTTMKTLRTRRHGVRSTRASVATC